MSINIKKDKASIMEIVLVAALMPYLWIIYGPLELFLTNKSEFWFDTKSILIGSLIMLLVTTLLAFLILFISSRVSSKLYGIIVSLEFIAYFVSYVHGNFLIKNLPRLDGTPPDWSIYGRDKVISAIVVLVIVAVTVAVICIFKLEEARKYFIYAMSAVSAVLLVTLGTLFIQNKDTGSQKMTITIKDMFTVSSDENVIVLLLDTVDVNGMYPQLPDNPEWNEEFKDFTLYPDTLGGYPATMMSVPLILTGEWYENEVPFEEYCDRVYSDSKLFNYLEDEKYNIGLYSTSVYGSKSLSRFTNIESMVAVKSYPKLSAMMTRLAMFKMAPYQLKRVLFFYPTNLDNLKKANDYDAFDETNVPYYELLKSAQTVQTTEKCFKYIHLNGAHKPYRLSKDVTFVEEGVSYEECVQGCMKIANELLSVLKDAGVYDNTAVVIMSDHGQTSEYRKSPLFMVKGVGEVHDTMQISNTAVTYGMVSQAFINLAQGSDAESAIWTAMADYQSERRFLNYEYMAEEFIEEYTQTGSVIEDNALVKTGKIYSLDSKKSKENIDTSTLDDYESVDSTPAVGIWGMMVPELASDADYIRVYGWVYDDDICKKPQDAYMEVDGELYKAEFIYLSEFASEDNDKAECGINVNIPVDCGDEIIVHIVNNKGELMNPVVIKKSDYID